MYGTNTYRRLDVDYPSDSQYDAPSSAKHPDANLSNYNTQLSRTILHDENRYGDVQVRPKPVGKYEYVHEPLARIDESTPSLSYDHRRDQETFVELIPERPVQANREPASIAPQPVLLSITAPAVDHRPAPPTHAVAETIVHHTPPSMVQPTDVEYLKAVELTNRRKLVQETHASIVETKENYRKCKRRNRLFLFVFVILLVLLLAVVRRVLMNPK